MVDISIRPETFVGMRFYSPQYKDWGYFCKKDNTTATHSWPWLTKFDNRGYGYSICVRSINPDYLLLSGEKGCPIDPKNKKWEWRVGDKIWIKCADHWHFDFVDRIGIDSIYLMEKTLSFDYCWKYALHIPRENKPIINLKDYPKTCPNCDSPAYIGLNSIDCSNSECR